MNNRWFNVEKEGLGKLVEQHGKGRLIAELLQNALDEDVTTVAITLMPQSNSNINVGQKVPLNR